MFSNQVQFTTFSLTIAYQNFRFARSTALLVSMIFFCSRCAHADIIYSAAADFSTASNPNGVWSYGWTQTLGSSFNLNLLNSQDATFGRWIGSVVSPLGNFPGVTYNRTNQTVNVGTIQYLPGQLNLHPGPGGEYSVVRFVAPATAQYSLSTVFGGMDFAGPTTSDVRVLLNTNAIFNGNVNSFGSGPTFSTLLNLQAGDRIDFAVGFGSNGTYFNDSTSLSAQITAVPEPTSILLSSVGSIVMIGLTRRNRNGRTKR